MSVGVVAVEPSKPTALTSSSADAGTSGRSVRTISIALTSGLLVCRSKLMLTVPSLVLVHAFMVPTAWPTSATMS